MPLLNGPTLTPKKLAANRANAQLSHGPVTLEGLIRVRDSNIKHGVYVQEPTETLPVLGEDPKDFERLLESLQATFQPADELESRLVKRLARAILRTERNDRVQESMAVRQVREMSAHVDRLVQKVCAQYDEKVAHLECLAQRIADDHFATGAEDLDHFAAACGDAPEGRAREILVCLNLLLDPVEFGEDAEAEPGGNSEARDEEENESASEVDADEEGAEASDNPETGNETQAATEQPDPLLLPDVPIATGPERIEARKRMESLLAEEIQALKATRDWDRENLLKTNTPYFRDSAIATSKPQVEAVLRREDASVRHIGRLTELLMKLKREKREAERLEEKNQKMQNEGESHDVVDNKGSNFLSHDVIDNKAT
jgi:hypothetical protein